MTYLPTMCVSLVSGDGLLYFISTTPPRPHTTAFVLTGLFIRRHLIEYAYRGGGLALCTTQYAYRGGDLILCTTLYREGGLVLRTTR